MAWHFTHLFWEPSANWDYISLSFLFRHNEKTSVHFASSARTHAKNGTQVSQISICASAITSKKNKKRSRLSFSHEYYQYFNTFIIGFGAKRLSRTIGKRRFLQTTGWQWGRLWSVYLFKHLLKRDKVTAKCGGCQVKRNFLKNVSKTVRGGYRKDSINRWFNIMHDAVDDVLKGGFFLFMIIE